jgi:hypothetical protein
MLLQVWVRGRRKNMRALTSPRQARTKGARSRRVREWSVKIRVQPLRACGFFLPIRKEPIVPHDRLSSPVKSRSVLRSRTKGTQRAHERSRNRLKTDCSPAASFCHFEFVTDIIRGIFGTHNRLGFWDANPSYKYVRVPDTEYTKHTTHNTSQLACCAAAYATSSCSSACTSDQESRSPEPRPQRSCTGRGRIRFLGSALCDCSNASISPSSTSSSPRLVYLLVSGTRLGIVKRTEVLIVAVVIFAWLFQSHKKRTVFCP